MNLQEATNERIAPLLRQMGFKGGGRNFRRERTNFCDWISIGKGRKLHEGYFAINLGCHPLLPLEPGKGIIPKTFSDCWFSTRLRPQGKDDQWWAADPVANADLEQIEEFLRTRASEWFSKLDTLDSTFGEITPEAISGADGWCSEFEITEARFAFVAARALLALDRPKAALAIAKHAHLLAGERALILRDWVDGLIQEIESSHQ